MAGNSIESPRLLLNSASSLHPDGLGNSARQLIETARPHRHADISDTCWGIFERPVPFSAPANPTLTVVAVVIRQADHLAEQMAARVI